MSWWHFYLSKETRTSSSPTAEKMSGESKENVMFGRAVSPAVPQAMLLMRDGHKRVKPDETY